MKTTASETVRRAVEIRAAGERASRKRIDAALAKLDAKVLQRWTAEAMLAAGEGDALELRNVVESSWS